MTVMNGNNNDNFNYAYQKKNYKIILTHLSFQGAKICLRLQNWKISLVIIIIFLKRKLAKANDGVPTADDEVPSTSKKPKRTVTKLRKAVIEDDTTNVESFGHYKCKEYDPLWKDHELLAENKSLGPQIAKNIIKLLMDGNTIPFIARYRREATGNMSPEMLREVKSDFEEIISLKHKIQTDLNTVEKTGKLSQPLEKAIKSSRSLEELEIIFAPYKPESKGTLAQRAKDMGLEKPALNLLYNSERVDLNYFVNTTKELKTIEDVEKGVIHIIAHVISTNTDMLSFLREFRKEVHFTLESKKVQTKKKLKIISNDMKKQLGKTQVDESKFENYFDFKVSVRNMKPHQVLAINRGEHQKVLSVKIVTPDIVFHKFNQFCSQKWVKQGDFNHNRKRILDEAVKDSYNRLVQPFIIREIRAELRNMAEKASYEVFSKNLKHLLLAGPVKGQPILGIDPGYSKGCKVALVSPLGSVLASDVIYPHKPHHDTVASRDILRYMLQNHNCSLIALGNGTACRETEEWLTQLIKNNEFNIPNVKYTIVNEDGASIYSCSPEAKKEFPYLDTNIISAISLARRVQDPLSELVKVEPKHLGVGMYQHDLKKKSLEEALDEVVSECVSFVGVDLNTASQCLLRRIAGLSDKRATQIVEHREKNGPFMSRKQLTEVSGIGPKTFEQCAGFLRVGPTDNTQASNFYKSPKTTKLDCTYIHPESYSIAKKLIKKLKLKVDDIGESPFITSVKSFSNFNITDLIEELNSPKETLQLILDALSKPLNYDLRSEVPQIELFRSGLKSMEDISLGSEVSGRVKNVTHFGCFVDIGVGRDALIHISKLGGFNLQVGDRVVAEVCALELHRQRIGLKPLKKGGDE
ncbi:S1 RNA-binding domain-containing protein 1 isoform X2 [Leptinotarsa decemlineata]|uniref:S1 RNA-binding domain-containing protein 1 isoform X2 n=1 Tax=Leptinotarsa decemlineata TaxID=7539 RepID=UPI003D306AAF